MSRTARPRTLSSTLARAGLVVLLVLSVTRAGVTAASRSRVSPLRPSSALHGGVSPFKLAGGSAHGIVPRRQILGIRAASRYAGASCTTSCPGQLLYRGGPVLHGPINYSLYWAPPTPASNGQAGTSFTPFPRPDYEATINSFLSDVASASGTLRNAYSVDTQYAGGGPGEYRSTFGEGFLDTHEYPTRNLTTCPASTKSGDGLPPATQPCISDSEGALQIPEEIVRLMNEYNAAHPTKHLPTGLGAVYYVFTPKEVNSCAGSEGGVAACNTNRYCAYHSAFLLEPGERIVVYANMPYNAVPGCSTPDEPHKSPADDEINTLSHEDNEAVTDPLGDAWYDNAGNEVADKCTYPLFNPGSDSNVETDAYGELLGGTPLSGSTIGTAYNQLVNGGTYLLQREWSNAAGGCVTQAPVPVASFKVYPSPATVGQTVSFNGSGSSASAGAITSYQWEFEGGQKASDPEATYTYQSAGSFKVLLSVTNDSGASASTSQTVTVNEAPPGGQTTTVTTTVTTPAPPPTTVTTPAPPPVTLTNTVLVPAEPTAYTAAQIARKLGLPRNGAKLPGLGTIGLGHAQCPPVCSVVLDVYTRVPTTRHGRRGTRRILIGTLTTTVAPKGTGALALRLNAAGRALLHRAHMARCTLVVTVQGQEGGVWRITRTLTLANSGRVVSRHGSRR